MGSRRLGPLSANASNCAQTHGQHWVLWAFEAKMRTNCAEVHQEETFGLVPTTLLSTEESSTCTLQSTLTGTPAPGR